jgi:hypothetical protein
MCQIPHWLSFSSIPDVTNCRFDTAMSFRLLRIARTCRILKLAQNREAFSWYPRHFAIGSCRSRRDKQLLGDATLLLFSLGQIFRFLYIVGPTLPFMVMVLSLSMRMHTNSPPHPAAIFRIVSQGRGWIDMFRCAAARIVIAKPGIKHCINAKACLLINLLCIGEWD